MDTPNVLTPAEIALRRSEAEYRSLFEAAGTANAEVELPAGFFVRVNKRYCDLVGYTAEELLGRMTFLSITHPDDLERNTASIRAFMRGEQGSFEIEKRYVRKDGSIVWVHLTATLIRDADGKATRLLGSATDITDRSRGGSAARRARDVPPPRRQLPVRHLRRRRRFPARPGQRRRAEGVRERAAAPGTRLRRGAALHLAGVVRQRGDRSLPSHARDGRALPRAQHGRAPARHRSGRELRLENRTPHAAGRTPGRRLSLLRPLRTTALRGGAARECRGVPRHVHRVERREGADGRGGADPARQRGAVRDDRLRGGRAGRAAGARHHARRRPHPLRRGVRGADARRGGELRGREAPRAPRRGDRVGTHDDQPHPRRLRPAGARAIAVVQDITERKRAEAALREAQRRKDEFLATLAHELRNPLAPLMNSLELLNHVSGTDRLAEQARQTMQRQLAHLVRLVDDLLDVSRITSGKVTLRKSRTDLCAVVRDAVDTCQPLAREARHELLIDLPPDPIWIDGDPIRLAQVVANLLNNACKYTPEGGRITIAASCDAAAATADPTASATASVRVRDTGIGIPPDRLDDVFEIFCQVDRHVPRARGGLGIGLSLVKGLVALHGGTVEAHSEGEGRGSEFVVRLPVALVRPAADSAPEPRARARARDDRPDPAPRRVLVVDDNGDTARSMARLLMLDGHQTRTASDGPEALQAAEQFGPDLVLLDIGLPSMSGYDVCRAIRSKLAGRKPVIVALTGWGQEEDRRRSAEAGFDHHLVKPVEYAKLYALLEQLAADAAR